MLKSVSSITNAIGALNFQGTWNASTNTPTLTSSVGTKGDYYVVGTAGSTTLNGISNWGVGDLATFNGSVWQRVEGGADGNFVNLSVSSTSTLSGLTASTALALNASKEIVSVTNTGTGDNVLATAPTLVGNVTLSTGNLVMANTKGIDFSATSGTGTSELLNDYEQGTWTPAYSTTGGSFTYDAGTNGWYTKIGNTVFIGFRIYTTVAIVGTGGVSITGLPFTPSSTHPFSGTVGDCRGFAGDMPDTVVIALGILKPYYRILANGANQQLNASDLGLGGANHNLLDAQITYIV